MSSIDSYGIQQRNSDKAIYTRLWRDQILRRERVVQLTTSRIGNLTRWLMLTLAICVTMQALYYILYKVPYMSSIDSYDIQQRNSDKAIYICCTAR